MIRNREEEVRNKILAVAANATEADHVSVNQIIQQALLGDFQSETGEITPGAAALLFTQHNSFNREWIPTWSEELARRQTSGEWKLTNATIGFYKSGKNQDGQNRLAAIALSGQTVDVIFVYGIEESAITATDDNRKRQGSDTTKLHGVQDSVRKQQIVKSHAAYLTKAGIEGVKLHSNEEVVKAIESNNDLLDEAISLGTKSCDNVASPVFKEAQAQTIAYLLLKGGWERSLISERLHLFQSGVAIDGENSPFFVAAKLVRASHEATSKQAKLTTTKELGTVVEAMQLVERGVKAVQPKHLRDAVKSTVPSPQYPSSQEEDKAAA